jgi:hypothetical protein
MLIDAGPGSEVAVRPGSSTGAGGQCLRHVQLRTCSTRSPARTRSCRRASVPFREGRRDVEGRESGSAERFPALRLRLRGGVNAGAREAIERSQHERSGVHEPAGAEATSRWCHPVGARRRTTDPRRVSARRPARRRRGAEEDPSRNSGTTPGQRLSCCRLERERLSSRVWSSPTRSRKSESFSDWRRSRRQPRRRALESPPGPRHSSAN